MNRLGAAMAALACLLAAVVVAQEKGGGDETGPYDLVAGWPQNYCGAGHIIGSTAGIWTERVHVGPPQKFRPKKGANPAHIIGRYMRGGTD